ncbi:MAG: hypothetical protein J3R72DRAFT_435359 [Linnemannia gamsii]|nr:MAG: hypothetical protein J3R72DRAFT_435359 [Linnemannia gamsii]
MLPQDAPSGNVTFMWLWYNAIGQRELYSNCADIRIEGRDGGSVKGLAPLIANYGPSNLVFPEFPTDEDPDMHELFETRAAVTIEVIGSNSPSQTGTAPASPSETCQPSRASRSIFAGSSFFWTSFIVFVSSFVLCLTVRVPL